MGPECCGRLKKKAKPTLPRGLAEDCNEQSFFRFSRYSLPRVNCKRLNAAPKGLGGGIAGGTNLAEKVPISLRHR